MYHTEYKTEWAKESIMKEEEYEIDPKLLKNVGAEHTTDIFSDNVEKLLEEDILSKEIVKQKELVLYLFKESQVYARTAKNKGKRQC